MASSTSSCALLAAIGSLLNASWNSSTSNLFAFHPLKVALLNGGLFLAFRLSTDQLMSRRSLALSMSCTVQSFPTLAKLGLTRVRSIIELSVSLSKVGRVPVFRRVKSNHDIASRSSVPLSFVFLLPHSSAQALKSPAMEQGECSLASSTSLSSKSVNSLIFKLGGA